MPMLRSVRGGIVPEFDRNQVIDSDVPAVQLHLPALDHPVRKAFAEGNDPCVEVRVIASAGAAYQIVTDPVLALGR